MLFFYQLIHIFFLGANVLCDEKIIKTKLGTKNQFIKIHNLTKKSTFEKTNNINIPCDRLCSRYID